ncbi:MAG: nitroreductase [Lachnospiraceae bacterium]|nr:nitroreductase [Lachnospiraceae bacterium]
MNTIECIKSRRSVRSFTGEKPSREIIEQIISAAAFAPSWKNTQITRYIIIEDDSIKSEIAAACDFDFNVKTMKQAPALVAVTAVKKRSGYERDGSYSTGRGNGWQMFDAGIASQTFCLAAHEYGLGTVILGIFNQEETEKLIKLPEDRELIALIALGVPETTPEAPKRKTIEELVTYL